jgi:hypothetical protein
MFNFYMDQLKIRDLLIEAANPECSERRINEIHCELGQATVMDVEVEVGFQTLLDSLYVRTVQNRPELLPTLFPIFAIICGDREEDMLIADVDWTIVS